LLILSRELNDSIIIADDVQIKVLLIENMRVLLGIKAPKSVSIHRKEVYQAMQRELMNSKKPKVNDRYDSFRGEGE
jgi:carbon storage regulator